MRAYRFSAGEPLAGVPGAALGLRLDDAGTPAPGPGELFLRLEASALNFVDLLMMSGMLPGAVGLVPLLDGAGRVVAVGAGVTRFAPGDRVVASPQQNWIAGPASPEQGGLVLGCMVDGTLRDHALFPEGALVAVPEGVSIEAAASLPCAGLSAWNTLFGSAARPTLPGETLLVLGTGGVSMFAVQFAVACGVRVIATTSTAAKAERLRAMGADAVIDYVETPHWAPEVLRLTGGRGVDAVCEVGGAATLPQSLQAVRVGGKIALIGIVGGPAAFDYNVMMLVSQKVLTIFGNGMGSAADLAAMLRFVAMKGIEPVIDRRFAFDEAPAAYAHFAARAHVGKVIIAN